MSNFLGRFFQVFMGKKKIQSIVVSKLKSCWLDVGIPDSR